MAKFISSMTAIFTLAAMLFLIVVATGIAHASEQRGSSYKAVTTHYVVKQPAYFNYYVYHAPSYYAWSDIYAAHYNQRMFITYVSYSGNVTTYQWHPARGCYTREFPGSTECLKAHMVDRHHRGHTRFMFWTFRNHAGVDWKYTFSPSGQHYVSLY